MAGMKAPKQPKTIIQPFKTEQIKTLLLLCDDSFLGSRNKAIVLLFLDTGLRLKELSNMQLRDIDMERETTKVMGKGAKERIVRMGKLSQRALLNYLLKRKDKLPCVWLSEERQPLTCWGVEEAITSLCHRVQLVGVRGSPHTFRNTFATTALLNGAREDEVQALPGHETQYMTAKYRATLNSQNAIEGHRKFSPVDNLKLK